MGVAALAAISLLLSMFGGAFAVDTTDFGYGLPNPGVTPDSILYFFDRLGEQIQLLFTFDPLARAQLLTQQAAERAAEAVAMAEAHKTAAMNVALGLYQEAETAAAAEIAKVQVSVYGYSSEAQAALEAVNASTQQAVAALQQAAETAVPEVQSALQQALIVTEQQRAALEQKLSEIIAQIPLVP